MMACLLAVVGCGEEFQREEAVPIDKLPPAALKAAQSKLPGVKFDTAWKVKAEGGKEGFEIRGKTKDGKIRDAQVTATGEVLEVD
jgi:hypothetical protein